MRPNPSPNPLTRVLETLLAVIQPDFALRCGENGVQIAVAIQVPQGHRACVGQWECNINYFKDAAGGIRRHTISPHVRRTCWFTICVLMPSAKDTSTTSPACSPRAGTTDTRLRSTVNSFGGLSRRPRLRCVHGQSGGRNGLSSNIRIEVDCQRRISGPLRRIDHGFRIEWQHDV